MPVYLGWLSNNFIVQSVQVEDFTNDEHLNMKCVSEYCKTAVKRSCEQSILWCWTDSSFLNNTGMLISAFAMFNSLWAAVVLSDFGGGVSAISLWSTNQRSAINVDTVAPHTLHGRYLVKIPLLKTETPFRRWWWKSNTTCEHGFQYGTGPQWKSSPSTPARGYWCHTDSMCNCSILRADHLPSYIAVSYDTAGRKAISWDFCRNFMD